MKTPMQEAIELFESMVQVRRTEQWEKIKNDFLAKEKQAIIEAFSTTLDEEKGFITWDNILTEEGEQYFNEKYE